MPLLSAPHSSQFPYPSIEAPKPPYYAVIIASVRRLEADGYFFTAQRIDKRARKQPGFLSLENVSNMITPSTDDHGESTGGPRAVTVSYWKDLESIRGWKRNSELLVAQSMGRNEWLERFEVRVCKVEKAYGFSI